MQNKNIQHGAAAVPSRGGFQVKQAARETGLWIGLGIFIYFIFHYAISG